MTKIGKYELLESLGKGSYGEVYRARNPLGVVVALKLLRHELVASSKAVEDFKREAALAMSLRHPNIVPVLDYDEVGGDYFIVMDNLEGQRLDKVLEEGQLFEQKRALAVLRDLAAGLDYAHGKGVLHRDLKPTNVILLAKDGRAVILGFGLPRELEGGSADPYTGVYLTRLGRGMASYMAPEQIRWQALSAQTDLYALGVVAYRLLVGRLPFEGDVIDVLEGHLRRTPPEAHTLNPKLPQAVSAVLGKALAKKPDERPESAAALVAALAKAFNPPPMQAPAPRGKDETGAGPNIIGSSGGHGYHRPAPTIISHSGGQGYYPPDEPPTAPPVPAQSGNIVRRYGRIEYFSPMDKDLEYRLRVGFLMVRHARKILERARIHWKNFEFLVAEDEPILRVIPSSSYFYISPAFRDVKVLKGQDVFAEFKIMPHHVPETAGNTCGLTIDFEYKGAVVYTLSQDVKVQCPFRFGPIQIAHQHWSRVGVLGGFIAAFDTAASLFSFMSPTHSIEESAVFIFIFLASIALVALSLYLRQRSGKRIQKEF